MNKRQVISMDLRERILAAYDEGQATREAVARRFRVSLAMVKKLLAQRRRTGDIAPRYHRCGRRPYVTNGHQTRLRDLVSQKPDMTLEELRDALGLECTPQAIHFVLLKMGVTLKKKDAPRQRTRPPGHRQGTQKMAQNASLP